jgi:hypothetical protein
VGSCNARFCLSDVEDVRQTLWYLSEMRQSCGIVGAAGLHGFSLLFAVRANC